MPRDWTQPQIVPAQRLALTIAEAAIAGFEAVRLETWKRPFGYRVTFQRMPDASECRNARPAQFEDCNHFATADERGRQPARKIKGIFFKGVGSKVNRHSCQPA